jgi:hypothetical protein
MYPKCNGRQYQIYQLTVVEVGIQNKMEEKKYIKINDKLL